MYEVEAMLKNFYAEGGHFALGYDSFSQWYDAEMSGIPFATGVRNWVITRMLDDAREGKSRVPAGTLPAIAAMTGTTTTNVNNIRTRSRYATNRTVGRKDDDKTVVGIVVDERWRRHMIAVANNNNMNMSDVHRTALVVGMKRKYGVDLNEPIEPVRTTRK